MLGEPTGDFIHVWHPLLRTKLAVQWFVIPPRQFEFSMMARGLQN